MAPEQSHTTNGSSAGNGGSPVAPTGIVVVDGDPLARTATREAIAAQEGLEVVGEAASTDAALKVCAAVAPAVVVVELDVGEDHGRQLVAALAALPSPPRVLPFSHLGADQVLVDTLRAGACGFVPKESGTEALVASLRAVLRGEVALTRVDTMRVIEVLRRARPRSTGMRPVRSPLTTREWEIFDLMVAGDTTRQMADQLVVSEATVYSHVKSILRKLGVHSRSEAIAAVQAMTESADRRRGG